MTKNTWSCAEFVGENIGLIDIIQSWTHQAAVIEYGFIDDKTLDAILFQGELDYHKHLIQVKLTAYL